MGYCDIWQVGRILKGNFGRTLCEATTIILTPRGGTPRATAPAIMTTTPPLALRDLSFVLRIKTVNYISWAAALQRKHLMLILQESCLVICILWGVISDSGNIVKKQIQRISLTYPLCKNDCENKSNTALPMILPSGKAAISASHRNSLTPLTAYFTQTTKASPIMNVSILSNHNLRTVHGLFHGAGRIIPMNGLLQRTGGNRVGRF